MRDRHETKALQHHMVSVIIKARIKYQLCHDLARQPLLSRLEKSMIRTGSEKQTAKWEEERRPVGKRPGNNPGKVGKPC